MEEAQMTFEILQRYWTQTYPSVRMAYLYFVPSSLSWSQSTTRWRTAGNTSASSTIFCSTKQQLTHELLITVTTPITKVPNLPVWFLLASHKSLKAVGSTLASHIPERSPPVNNNKNTIVGIWIIAFVLMLTIWNEKKQTYWQSKKGKA